MPKSVYDRGLMRPAELDKLQRVFDETCRKRDLHPEAAEARELALTLLALYNAGMSDEAMLRDTLAFRRPEARSA